jgi:selenophosphate synthase
LLQVALRINSSKVPLLPGAQELLQAGLRSTAHAGNVESIRPQLRDALVAELSHEFASLVDPQTSGAPIRNWKSAHIHVSK